MPGENNLVFDMFVKQKFEDQPYNKLLVIFQMGVLYFPGTHRGYLAKQEGVPSHVAVSDQTLWKI